MPPWDRMGASCWGCGTPLLPEQREAQEEGSPEVSASLKLTVSTPGLDKLNGSTKAFREVVRSTAKAMVLHATDAITQGAKTGRIYVQKRTTTSKKGRKRTRAITHQASAPGEAPSGDSGTLAASISAKAIGPLASEVRVDAEYGAHLEFGTTKMAARPFFLPALDAVRPEFEKQIAEVLRRAHE